MVSSTGDSRFHVTDSATCIRVSQCLHHHQFATLRQHPQSQQRASSAAIGKEDLDIIGTLTGWPHTRAQRVISYPARFSADRQTLIPESDTSMNNVIMMVVK